MLFNSLTFAVFYVAVFGLYWLVRARQPQNLLLLAASWFFYAAWSAKFLLLLIGTSVLDYVCGRLIEAAPTPHRKRLVLLVSVCTNLSVLAIFKYLGFFVAEFAQLLTSLGLEAHLPTLSIVLPVGISFYTFQSIGYVVDVYRGKIRAARNPVDYGLYVAFFPQLVAGPIERAAHLIPQFQKPRAFSGVALESGLQLVFWGLFKKVVIADNLAAYVDVVYAAPADYSGAALVTATVFFAFQIYCDFSGYTDIARGVARTLGFELIRNFDDPYRATSPVDFWRRWHMSLSQWFQDYLYYPLALKFLRRGGWLDKYKAHIVSMALIGLWHGANWTFLVFGLYWGIAIALYLAVVEARRGAPAAVAQTASLASGVRHTFAIVAMFAVVCVGWVFFRAASIGDAWYVLTHLFSTSGIATVVRTEVASTSILWALVVGLYCAEWIYRQTPRLRDWLAVGRVPAVAGRYALLGAILLAHSTHQIDVARPFIYFQF
jgi:D-alanyl-lipoteichoic acid acyltransferase DltB (MBOAT superfamily)